MAINYGKLNAKLTPRGSLKATMGVSGPLNSDYEAFINKPQINGNELIGNKSNEDLGIPTKTSDLENDSNFVSDENYVHTDNNYDDTDKGKVDALGTASTKNVPAEGNASASEVVMGSDTRLTNSRPASDVYDWAKAQTKPSYSYSEIQNTPTINNSTITIQKNNQNVDSFTLNQDSNKSINISVPTKTSDLQNDNSFITNTVNNLANYYLKTQTYTQAEVDALIQAAVNGRFQKVNTLPASGEPNVIYLVPKTTPETSNACDEYIWQDNAWELIGSTEIDLSDYVTDEDLATTLQSYLTTSAFATAIANYYTKTEVGTLLDNKVDKADGKGLSTYDYDATAKAIVDSVTANLDTKVDKVAGKGLSTNDYDNTAKGIVDGVTSALAGKVDKATGKGLSTNDYTTAEKTKLAGISEGANKVESSETNGNIQIDGEEVTVYNDEDVKNAIEDIDDIITTDTSTVEGNPINFFTKSAQNATSTLIDLEPIQDLHGFNKPWVGGAGKNLLPFIKNSVTNYDNSGIDFTVNRDTDGNLISVKVNGTSTKTVQWNVHGASGNSVLPLSAGTYIVNGAPSNKCKIRVGDSNNNYMGQDTGLGYSFTADGNGNCFQINIENGVTVSNELVYPMLRFATETDSSFAPYTNECSISGHAEIGILGCGVNIWDEEWELKAFDTTSHVWFSANRIASKNYISVNPNTDYYFKAPNGSLIVFYDENKNYISHLSTQSAVFTTPNSSRYVLFQMFSEYGTTTYNNDISVNYPSSDTSYHACQKSNDLTISLGQTVYGGTLDVENGVLVVDRKIKTITDSTGFSLNATSGRWYAEGLFPDFDISTRGSDKNISNQLKWQDSWAVGVAYFVIGTARGIYINRLTTDETLSDLTTRWTANPIQICYCIEPITINLTPNTINLLKGVNNISVDDANATITLTYRDGSVATLGDLTSAVDSLEGKIEDSKILTDTATGDKYILVVTNGVLDIQQISN